MFSADKIYLINLLHRTDRLRIARLQFDRAGINEYTIFPAIDAKRLKIKGVHEDNQGLVGCFMSHYLILREAIINKYKKIVVFEDDVILVENFKEKFEEGMRQIPNQWQFLYLGYYERTFNGKIKVSENVVIPKNTWGTHAYMVQNDGIKIMYDNLQEIKTHIDIQIGKDIVPKMYTYCIYPALCNQSGIRSDIK